MFFFFFSNKPKIRQGSAMGTTICNLLCGLLTEGWPQMFSAILEIIGSFRHNLRQSAIDLSFFFKFAYERSQIPRACF